MVENISEPQFPLVDLLQWLGGLIAIIGLWATFIQLRRTARTERCRFLLEATDRYFGNEELRKFYYRLDYEQWKFEVDTFPLSDDERLLDGLIYNFDVIGNMVKMGALSQKEVYILAYQAMRVLGNPEVKKYLEWLDDEYARVGRPLPAHKDARDLVAGFDSRR